MPFSRPQPCPTDALLDELLMPYGMLWPLEAFNACNPLVGLESLPFATALKSVGDSLGCEFTHTAQLFQKLRDKSTWTIRDLNHVLEGWHFPNKTIDVGYPETYKAICHHEVLAMCSAKPETADVFSHTVRERLALIFRELLPDMATQPSRISPSLLAYIDEQTSKYLAAYFDEGQALWGMPKGEGSSLLAAWARLVEHDQQVSPSVRQSIRQWLASHGSQPASEQLTALLHQLALAPSEEKSLLNDHMRQLPGWIGYLQFLEKRDNCKYSLITDYLVIRLVYQQALHTTTEAGVSLANSPEHEESPVIEAVIHRLSRLYAHQYQEELSVDGFVHLVDTYRHDWWDYFNAVTPVEQVVMLINTLEYAQQTQFVYELETAYQEHINQATKPTADAQAVFCMDVRSEPYRKILESVGNIDTYGFAGFFGLPIAKQGYTDNQPTALCPILLEPSYTIPEAVAPFLKNNTVSRLCRQFLHWREQWAYALKKIKRDTFATFGYVEGLGVIHGWTMVRDSFLAYALSKPGKKYAQKYRGLLGLSPSLEDTSSETPIDLGGNTPSKPLGIPLAEQINMAEAVLTLMGLKAPYAQFVIMCGHTAQVTNNPYASSLDCGACGANRGGYNAEVLCQMLNNAGVRDELFGRGILIPEHTRFIAAEHNTTTDEVSFLNTHIISTEQQQAFLNVKCAFGEATQRLQYKREHVPQEGAFSFDSVKLNAVDWSQTRPEWGLSRNQALIIGQRKNFEHVNLQGRAFLHSYDVENDADGQVLTTIMTAPMVVAAWINCQYLFSTLDHQRFGSGKKYTHNVVGLLGTYQGNRSDLQLGLPYESLFENDGTPYHYPQRLLVCIEAPMERVDAIVQGNEQVKQLVENQWIQLMVIHPETGAFTSYLENSLLEPVKRCA